MYPKESNICPVCGKRTFFSCGEVPDPSTHEHRLGMTATSIWICVDPECKTAWQRIVEPEIRVVKVANIPPSLRKKYERNLDNPDHLLS